MKTHRPLYQILGNSTAKGRHIYLYYINVRPPMSGRSFQFYSLGISKHQFLLLVWPWCLSAQFPFGMWLDQLSIICWKGLSLSPKCKLLIISLYLWPCALKVLIRLFFLFLLYLFFLKGIFSDSNNIFFMARIRRYKQKKSLFPKFQLKFQFYFFQVMPWLCVFHCSHRILCWIKSRVRDFLLKMLSFHTEMISA